MGQPYVGEIRMFGGNFAPNGWAFCDGQLLDIAENDAFYNLIGTTYGGDGVSTFAVPDLRGRIPVHQSAGGGGYFGSTYIIGQSGGVEEVTLNAGQIPTHTHALLGSTAVANSSSPVGRVLARPSKNLYRPGAATDPLGASVSNAGGSQPHSNLQPYGCVNFIISLFGIYPTQ